MSSNLTIGFLGAGKMASALAAGFLRAGLTRPEQILASDPVESARGNFSQTVGAKTTAFNPDVRPSLTSCSSRSSRTRSATCSEKSGGQFSEKHLLISIAAGVTLAKLESALQPGARIIRVMPNTPALIGASATAYALGKAATADDGQLAQRLFRPSAWPIKSRNHCWTR